MTLTSTIHGKIPTGSLGLIAGGLSAGIGLALKDVINNFIYGIQLMGGRLRVGDWIECDSAVQINVKQMVLVAERVSYFDRAKEAIYDTLTAAGITIAFPQCDVHLIQEE